MCSAGSLSIVTLVPLSVWKSESVRVMHTSAEDANKMAFGLTRLTMIWDIRCRREVWENAEGLMSTVRAIPVVRASTVSYEDSRIN